MSVLTDLGYSWRENSWVFGATSGDHLTLGSRRTKLIRRFFCLFVLLLNVGAKANEGTDAPESNVQKSLEQWCESAKENERQELKRRILDICQSKGRPKKQCEQEAATYGSLSVSTLSKAAELPVCVQAAQYRKAHDSEK